jgi:hypothetical protein
MIIKINLQLKVTMLTFIILFIIVVFDAIRLFSSAKIVVNYPYLFNIKEFFLIKII